MSSESSERSQAIIPVLLDPRHRRLFDTLMEKVTIDCCGDAAARNFIRSASMSRADRTVLEMAYALWRGYGPALTLDKLWGLDRQTAVQLLAAMAMAVDAEDAAKILEEAAARCPKPGADEEPS